MGAISDDDSRGAVYLLFLNADGSVKQSVKIDATTPNGPSLSFQDFFGSSLTSLGDLDGDGVPDLAVGAIHDDTGGTGSFAERGAVHVLFLHADGSVKQTVAINASTPNGPSLNDGDAFGASVTSLGDLDGDGVNDLAVGAFGDDTGGLARGAVHVLFLHADGSVKQTVEINSSTPNGPSLNDRDQFGGSVTALGDLDGDGVNDLAVGATGDRPADSSNSRAGAVHVLLLNPDGSVKQSVEIDGNTPNGPMLDAHDFFGSSVTSLGDLNGDGVADLAVGASGDDSGILIEDSSRGAVHVLFLSPLPPQPASLELPAGGNYEILRDGGDLVFRVAGVPGFPDLLRQSANSVSVLEILGSAGNDIVTILNTGGVVVTIPIVFSGGQGADQFDASLATGSTTLLGGSGNDTLLGGTNDDFIIGGTGNDMIAGGNGDDRIGGRSGNDTLTGGDGNDTLQGGGGRDMIEGGGDSDQLSGAGGPDTIAGGDGDDLLRGGAGPDLLDGDGGEDTLVGGAGLDNLAGGVGNDTLNGVFRDDTFNQVVGRDTLFGGQRPAPRPAPVAIETAFTIEHPEFATSPEQDVVGISDDDQEPVTDIDEAFTNGLLPELLSL